MLRKERRSGLCSAGPSHLENSGSENILSGLALAAAGTGFRSWNRHVRVEASAAKKRRACLEIEA